jgi:hypothetical protein
MKAALNRYDRWRLPTADPGWSFGEAQLKVRHMIICGHSDGEGSQGAVLDKKDLIRMPITQKMAEIG